MTLSSYRAIGALVFPLKGVSLLLDLVIATLGIMAILLTLYSKLR